MKENNSIHEQLRPEAKPEIKGHDLMALERFAEHTRHMIVFDALEWDCPVGDKGDRIRIFLTDEGYRKALESEQRGEMVIRKYAKVQNGRLLYETPAQETTI